MLLTREKTSIEFGKDFAKLDVIKLLAFEKLVDAQLQEEEGIVESL